MEGVPRTKLREDSGSPLGLSRAKPMGKIAMTSNAFGRSAFNMTRESCCGFEVYEL
jgi:hypothetical protein